MKTGPLYFALLMGVAVGLSGCAEVDRIEDVLASAKATQDIATLKNGASALVCSIANAARVAQQIEASIAAGQSIQSTDGKLYVSSAAVCASLAGTVTGAGSVQ